MAKRTCTVEGCGKPLKARGRCDAHYQQWWKQSDPSERQGPRGVCAVEGSDRPHQARSWCKMHWARWRRYGSPLVERPRTPFQPVEPRFWAKVDKDGPLPELRPELGPCWLWTGRLNTSGDGVIGVDGGRMYTHRWSYTRFVGPIPDGLEMDHLCRRPACARPNHLEAVTRRQNMLRSPLAPSGVNAAKTHCVNGHEFTPENTYRRPDGKGRQCRTCNRLRSQEDARRAKAARAARRQAA